MVNGSKIDLKISCANKSIQVFNLHPKLHEEITLVVLCKKWSFKIIFWVSILFIFLDHHEYNSGWLGRGRRRWRRGGGRGGGQKCGLREGMRGIGQTVPRAATSSDSSYFFLRWLDMWEGEVAELERQGVIYKRGVECGGLFAKLT